MPGKSKERIEKDRKVVSLAITENRDYYVDVEVPSDVTDEDLHHIGEVIRDHPWAFDAADSNVDVYAEESEGQAADLIARGQSGSESWWIASTTTPSIAKQGLGLIHSELVKHFKHGGGEVPRICYSTRVCENDDGEVSNCTVYFQERLTVIVVYWQKACEVAVLFGYDHCFPVTKDGGGIPWSAVNVGQRVRHNEYGRVASSDVLQAMADCGLQIPEIKPHPNHVKYFPPKSRRTTKAWEVVTPEVKELGDGPGPDHRSLDEMRYLDITY